MKSIKITKDSYLIARDYGNNANNITVSHYSIALNSSGNPKKIEQILMLTDSKDKWLKWQDFTGELRRNVKESTIPLELKPFDRALHTSNNLIEFVGADGIKKGQIYFKLARVKKGYIKRYVKMLNKMIKSLVTGNKWV